MVAEALLKLFKGSEMVVYTGTLDSLRNFEHFSCFPVFVTSVLLYLVSASVVHESYLFASDSEHMRFLIDRMHLVDF